VTFQWTDNSQVETGYLIEWSSTGAPFSYTTFATLPANTTSYTLPGWTGDTNYWRVRALRNDPHAGAPVVVSEASNAAH
jgi:hypothetical protein